jgi:hypothetical protein
MGEVAKTRKKKKNAKHEKVLMNYFHTVCVEHERVWD